MADIKTVAVEQDVYERLLDKVHEMESEESRRVTMSEAIEAVLGNQKKKKR